MPCSDIRDSFDQQHMNQGAELLCDLIKRQGPAGVEWTPALRQWWEDHQNRDAYYNRMYRTTPR